MSYKAIWIRDQQLLDKFDHYKIDHGRDSNVALASLLAIAEKYHREECNA